MNKWENLEFVNILRTARYEWLEKVLDVRAEVDEEPVDVLAAAGSLKHSWKGPLVFLLKESELCFGYILHTANFGELKQKNDIVSNVSTLKDADDVLNKR